MDQTCYGAYKYGRMAGLIEQSKENQGYRILNKGKYVRNYENWDLELGWVNTNLALLFTQWVNEPIGFGMSWVKK